MADRKECCEVLDEITVRTLAQIREAELRDSHIRDPESEAINMNMRRYAQDPLCPRISEEHGKHLINIAVNAGMDIMIYPCYVVCLNRTPQQVLDAVGRQFTATHSLRIFVDSKTKETCISVVKGVTNYLESHILHIMPNMPSQYGSSGCELFTRMVTHLGISSSDFIPDGNRRFRLENCQLEFWLIREIVNALPRDCWVCNVEQDGDKTIMCIRDAVEPEFDWTTSGVERLLFDFPISQTEELIKWSVPKNEKFV